MHSAKVALFGAAGRMGHEILRLAKGHEDVKVLHAYDTTHTGTEVEGVVIEAPAHALPIEVSVVVDFSVAEEVVVHVQKAYEHGVPYVTGVTGLSAETRKALAVAADVIPVVYAPNMAPGMNVYFRVAQLIAQTLPDYERHILEIHHTQKKDAPSGTALAIAQAIRDVTQQDTSIQALRMGDVAGEHRLIFGGPGERIEIVHRADSRAVFAAGALRAAAWVVHQKPGLYSMAEVLGL